LELSAIQRVLSLLRISILLDVGNPYLGNRQHEAQGRHGKGCHGSEIPVPEAALELSLDLIEPQALTLDAYFFAP
jgi:glycerate kinase